MAGAFRFRLQTLLRVRGLREREALRRVAAKNAEIARLDLLDEQTGREITQQMALLRRSSEEGVIDPTDLARQRTWIAHLRRQMLQRQAQRTQLVAQREELLGAFRRARTELRVLANLRDRRREEHDRAQRLREQAAADELALALHETLGQDVPPGEAQN